MVHQPHALPAYWTPFSIRYPDDLEVNLATTDVDALLHDLFDRLPVVHAMPSSPERDAELWETAFLIYASIDYLGEQRRPLPSWYAHHEALPLVAEVVGQLRFD